MMFSELILDVYCRRNEKSLVSRSQPNMEQSADQSHFMELFDGSNGGPESKSMIGPLSAFTAECIDVMRAAQENIDIGRNLRFNSKQLIKECMENSKMYGNCINDAFVKKIEETLALSVSISQFNYLSLLLIN